MKNKFLIISIAIIAAAFAFVMSQGPQTSPDNTDDSIFYQTPSPAPVSPSPTPSASLPKSVLLDVPFTSQAPTANWSDDRYQDGCEEASMLMAIKWVRGEEISKQEAMDQIAAMAAFEQDLLGTYHDTSAPDTVKWAKDYFDYDKIENFSDITVDDIKKRLSEGKVVVVPADGTLLNNPNFTPPGPTRHMLVIRGYDENKKQFITNDPGTRKGEGYRYPYQIVFNAILDYPTGHHEPAISNKKVMIVVSK